MSVYEPRTSHRSAPFWAGVAAEEVRFQECESCGHRFMVPKEACERCGGHIVWKPSTGDATVYSYSVVRRAPTADLRDSVPYLLALVDLAEGPRMMTWIVDIDPEQVSVGMAVRLTFRPGPGGTVLPMFHPAG